MVFNIELEIINNVVKLILIGELDGGIVFLFKEKIEEVV